MANHGQQLCLATPLGEPCANPRQTQHPYLLEIPSCCCFGCKELVMVTREAARLSTKGVPLVSVDRVKSKFQIVGSGYQHPAGSVGGLARETLCALCTQPANGDKPMLECCGLRDGTACKLMWHTPCHEVISSTVAPPQDGVLQCCMGWPARAAIDPKDRFDVGYTFYRKGLAKPGSLRSKGAARGATAKASTAAVDDASTAATANAPVLEVAAQPPATPLSSSAPPAEVTPPTMVPPTSPVTPHMSSRAEPAGSNDSDDHAPSGPTGRPRRSLSNQTEDAAAIDGAMGGVGASAGASASASAGTGSVAGSGAAVPGAAQSPLQCERDAQCTRGFRHGGKGGKCSLRPRLPAAADASVAPKSKGRVYGPPADVGGIDWKNTAVDASRILDKSGAQCDVFLAAVSADPSSTFGHVWRGKEKPLPRHLWPKEKLELAVKTPKSVTEPAGDNESAMKERAEADMRLHWEARATHLQHTPSTATAAASSCAVTHLLLCNIGRYTLHPTW